MGMPRPAPGTVRMCPRLCTHRVHNAEVAAGPYVGDPLAFSMGTYIYYVNYESGE
jgi:hypothetical protein